MKPLSKIILINNGEGIRKVYLRRFLIDYQLGLIITKTIIKTHLFKAYLWRVIPKFLKRLTEKSNIEIVYNTNYNFENSHDVKYLTIYTGPLDKLLKNKFGKLE